MIPTLADLSDFLGNVWFAGLCLLAGYLLAHFMPISFFKRK